jgi:branched-chain amino acid aminotransferase
VVSSLLLSAVLRSYNFICLGIGTGAFKLGVNYAPGVMPQKEAALKGYAQNLWLHGPEHYLTEVRMKCSGRYGADNIFQVGTMNAFVVFKRDDGGGSNLALPCSSSWSILSQVLELVTPPLDGMILPGVTRASILSLVRDHISGKKRLADLPENIIVSERPVTMKEVKDASESGRIVELFGSGNTFLSPVCCQHILTISTI